MILHLSNKFKKPKRVIVLGSSGFISSNVIELLKKNKINYLPFNRKKLDLTKKSSKSKLIKILKKNDTILFVAADAPVKNEEMFLNNIKMCNNVCSAINRKQIKHLVYVSSDAVYSDTKKKISEYSKTLPQSLHGLMHLCREEMLRNSFDGPFCIVRPTLIYGKKDPHNGYGPNRFLRLAKKNTNIKLFGNGEELRDHVYIEDVSKIIYEILIKQSIGIINIATGQVKSFLEIAKTIKSILKSKSKIIKTKRIGKMPHGGYRAFNTELSSKMFPSIKYTSIYSGVSRVIKSK